MHILSYRERKASKNKLFAERFFLIPMSATFREKVGVFLRFSYTAVLRWGRPLCCSLFVVGGAKDHRLLWMVIGLVSLHATQYSRLSLVFAYYTYNERWKFCYIKGRHLILQNDKTWFWAVLRIRSIFSGSGSADPVFKIRTRIRVTQKRPDPDPT